MHNRAPHLMSFPTMHANREPVLLYWILALAAALTFFVNVLVDNSVVFHDEYVYKAASDHRLPQAELYAKGANEYIPNRLFVAVYRIASFAEQNFYVAAQFFNVVFWVLGILAVCKLAYELGVTGERLLAFGVLCGMLPFSTYTKYFMPEAMFFCLFALCILGVFKGIVRQSSAMMFGAGLTAGLAYYVKPHAVVFFGVTLVFIAFAVTGKQRWRNLASYAVGFVVIVLIASLLIDKPKSLSSLGIYERMVKGMMATSVTMLDNLRVNLASLGKVGLGHAILLLSVWTISLLTAAAACFSLVSKREQNLKQGRSGQQLFAIWLLFIMSALVAMAIVFTVLVAEVGRVHSRYYCFVYPFLLLALFVYEPARYSRGMKIAISSIAVFFGLALMMLPKYSEILGISLVSDSPEMGFVFLPRTLAVAAVILLVWSQIYAVWRNPRPFWLILAVLFLGSQYYVRNAQGHIFRGPYTDGRDSLAVEQLLGPEKVRSALVVGENRDTVSKFLFNLSVVPSVDQRPFGQLGTLLKERPEFDTYLLLTDKIEGVPELSCQLLGQRVLECHKN